MASLPQGPLPFQPSGIVNGFLSGAATGATIGSVGGPIGTAIGGAVGAVAGLIGSIFGGGPDTPTEQSQFINVLRAFFPNQNQTVCGQPFDLSVLNGGQPLWMNISCSDPNFGNATESTLEWWIKTYGLGSFLSVLSSYLFTSIGAATGQTAPPPGATPTSGIDTGLTNLTSTLTSVIGAITGAIDASTASAAAGQATAINAVQQTLGTFTSGLGTLQQNIGGVITSSIGSLLDSLFNPSGSVVGAITQAIEQLGAVQGGLLAQLTQAIESQISPLEQSLLGLPISLGSILRDVFKNLPQILVDLVNVFPGPLKGIISAIEVLISHLPGKTKTNITYDTFGDILARVMQAAESIAGTTGVPANVIYKPLDKLASSCTREESLKNLDNWVASLGQMPCWIQDGIKGLGVGFAEIAKLLEWFLQNIALGEEAQNKNCPLTKLPPSTAIQAWLRGFVSDADLDEELIVQGIAPSRTKVLKDIASHYYSAAEALDYWWRGIIDDNELSTLLAANGYNQEQQEAAKTGSFRITDLGTATVAWNRGLISDDAFGTIATANHLDSSQVDLFRVLRQRPSHLGEALDGNLKRIGLGNVSLFGLSSFESIPEWFSTAAAHDGLSDEATRNLWWSHFNLGGLGDWITAYYRGLRVYPQLVTIAESFGVTPEVLAGLVDIGRPLIPYRTIPAMVRAGIITEHEARGILGQHGFASADIDRLIKYAAVGTKTSKANTAATQHDISLATARTAYDDGILTQDQYMQLLQAHGLDANAAGVEVQIANISQEVKARKQISTDIVNEYNAGLLDQQTAIQQLATSGLSVAEQAAAVRKMKSSASSKAKQPSEAELRAWAKADIITPDEYQNRLVVIGWSSSDAANFRTQHFPLP